MPMRAKKKSRSRVPIKMKDPQADGFYDGLQGLPQKSCTNEYMNGYTSGEKLRLETKAMKDALAANVPNLI